MRLMTRDCTTANPTHALNIIPTFLRFGTATLALLILAGCQSNQTAVEDIQVAEYEQRMGEEKPFDQTPDLTPVDAPAPVQLSGDIKSTQPNVESVLWLHLPDPTMAKTAFEKRLEVTRFSENIRREYQEVYDNALKYVAEIERPKKFRLSLPDALRRALENNYQIKIDGYAPAISTAQVVQAEAAFDVAFFANVSRNNTDQPTPSQLVASQTDTTIVAGGIRKMLATGATVTLSESMTRVDNPGYSFQTINPYWAHSFQGELRQPLLRNFGIDFNRAQINIRKLEHKSNREAFRARVIEILNNTEQAYWQLVAARRNVVVSAELLGHAQLTLRQIEARKDFDAYQTLLFRSQSQVKAREFEYIDVKSTVRNAEDQLLNLLNDPDLPLSANFEIIPTDSPTTIPVVRDRFKSVETALEQRPEIIQARQSVDISRLNLGIAKNQALPTLDVIYRMTLSGIGASSDQAWDQMTGSNFLDQYVGMEFAWNFGERAERAGIRMAAFQQSQAVLAYKSALDNIITDCRVSLRNLDTSYQQIGPSHEAVIAAFENLRSLQERQERKSPAELDTILSAQTNLASSRRGLLQAITNYNTGIVDVERAKGTLLDYNNVVLAEQP